MAARTERCSGCGLQLLVPPETQTIRCAMCQATTSVGPYESTSQAHDPISQAARRFKDLVNTVSSNINTVAGSLSSYRGSGTYGYDYGSYTQPSRQVLPLPSSHGRKRALLCGLSYYGKSYKLKGTVNDVRCMRYFLIEKLGFPSDCIIMLTEDETNPIMMPTKQNIRMAMRWLVQGCQSGDSLVFYYSGHGSRQPNYNMGEIDRYDEELCPLDHETEGTIIDDEINATIVRPLPHGAKLHAIVDACYSGNVLDLPFLCRMNREGFYIWEDHGLLTGGYKGTSGGLAICISSCDNDQTSVDTT